jgi:chromosome segregation ATPase
MTDRLDLANAFEGAGIERRAAEHLADEVFAAIRENVVTRQDLQLAVNELRNEISPVRTEAAELRGDIHEGDARLRTEISELRGEVRAGDERLRGEISELRGEVRAGDERLHGEISDLRGEVRAGDERLHGEISELRGDIHEGDARLRTEISELRGEVHAGDERLRGEIRDLHSRLVWWIIGTGAGAVLALTGIFTALLKLIR